MNEVEKVINKLKNLPLDQFISETLSELENEILDEQRKQMLAGEDSKGTDFKFPKTHWTDLYETGEFQDTLILDKTVGGKILSNWYVTKYILNAIPDVFGVNESSLVYVKIKNMLTNKIINYLWQ